MKRLDEIEARTRAATEGPWEAEHHYNRLTGKHAVSEIPRVAECMGNGDGGLDCKEDAEFIAHARTDVPALVAVARFALSLHSQDRDRDECGHCADSYGEDGWPCSTVREIHRLLGEDA